MPVPEPRLFPSQQPGLQVVFCSRIVPLCLVCTAGIAMPKSSPSLLPCTVRAAVLLTRTVGVLFATRLVKPRVQFTANSVKRTLDLMLGAV